jgi:hypothetical protein
VLSRGLISGHWTKDGSPRDFRTMSPRFQAGNIDTNLALVEKLRAIASEIGASVAQVAIAWVAAQGNDIVPLIGARRRDRLTEALGALEVKLSPAHLADLAGRRRGRRALSGRAPGAYGQREEEAGVSDTSALAYLPSPLEGEGEERHQRYPLKSRIVGASPFSGFAGSRA